MQLDVSRVIEQVSKEKGISREVVVRAIENSMLSAARKIEGQELPLEAHYNEDIGQVEVFRVWTVVSTIEEPASQISVEDARARLDPEAEVGDELLDKLDMDYGRIAAQAAKQNLIQKIRDAEREIIYNEFKDRKGEILSGIVTRFERKNMIVQLRPNVDAILPEKEQIPRERYRPQDRIRAYVVEVDLTTKGPQIVLSRTHPRMLEKLFEQEVPEIYEKIVSIKEVAREPGGRAKIAVASNDADVDPVGACVGMKGTRVQAVVQELRGEKIDIVPWTEDPAEFVCRALAPAKVAKIVIDEDNGAMEVIVPDDQLSLAIGRKGQNVRLASKLSGWKLDVRSEGEAEEEARRARAALLAIPGVGDVTAEYLLQEGYRSAADLVEAGAEALQEIEGVEEAKAAEIIEHAAVVAEEVRRAEEEAAARAAAEAQRVRDLVASFEGVESTAADHLVRAGYGTIEAVARAETTRLVEILAADEDVVEQLRTLALRQVGSVPAAGDVASEQEPAAEASDAVVEAAEGGEAAGLDPEAPASPDDEEQVTNQEKEGAGG